MTRPSTRDITPPDTLHQSDSSRRSRSLVRDSSSFTSSRQSFRPRNTSADIYSKPLFAHRNAMIEKPFKVADIKRWDGNKRTTTSWNSLKRDPELWFPSGDCLVHFYGKGQSRRGPSLRLSLLDIETSNCRPMLEQCCAMPVPDSPSAQIEDGSSDDGGFFTNPSLTGKYELYMPAPAQLNREEAFQYHLTTRNFFAWMFEKPLVGTHLGSALIALMDRMNTFRPDSSENEDDVLAYIDSQGYTDFRECPDHALAALQFAEKFQNSELWTDAFVHCVGMNDLLIKSDEFKAISRVSKALITRAHIEMNLRLEKAATSLGNFLEDDLSTCLGLSNEAQKHLERFRSFLQSFYVQKDGYWPPLQTDRKTPMIPKSTLRSMYSDFRDLYEYLVDSSSTTSMNSNRPADGGVCVLQNVLAFDKKYKYISLAQPLSLIPDIFGSSYRPRAGGISALFGNKAAKNERRLITLNALAAATNSEDLRVIDSRIVREYARFERDCTMREEEKLSPTDARKVRWILVYAILQTLVSVTRAPTEVLDTESVSYPLCCQTAGTPPWTINSASTSTKSSSSTIKSSTPVSAATSPSPKTPTSVYEIPEIHPDLSFFSPKPLFAPRAPATTTPFPSGAPAMLIPPRISSVNHTLARNASNTTLQIRCPQPRKLVHDLLVNSVHRLSDHEGSDPDTPSSGESSRWSPASSDSGAANVMDHHSMAGSRACSPSVYGDDDVVEKKWEGFRMTGFRTCSPSVYGDDDGVEKKWEGFRMGLGMRRLASVESWRMGKINPEVDMYISSPSR